MLPGKTLAGEATRCAYKALRGFVRCTQADTGLLDSTRHTGTCPARTPLAKDHITARQPSAVRPAMNTHADPARSQGCRKHSHVHDPHGTFSGLSTVCWLAHCTVTWSASLCSQLLREHKSYRIRGSGKAVAYGSSMHTRQQHWHQGIKHMAHPVLKCCPLAKAAGEDTRAANARASQG